MLQSDPELPGVGCLIFDEFHERALQADLGLALALEARAALRPDLRLLVMSATLDAGPVAALMGGRAGPDRRGPGASGGDALARPAVAAAPASRGSRRRSPPWCWTRWPRPRAACWSSCPGRPRSPARPRCSRRGCRRDRGAAAARRAALRRSSAPRWRRSAARAQARARHRDRRDLADHPGRAGRRRRRPRPAAAFRPGLGHDAAGHRARRPAPRPSSAAAAPGGWRRAGASGSGPAARRAALAAFPPPEIAQRRPRRRWRSSWRSGARPDRTGSPS